MPRGDGTGPTGVGARSGRAAGYCAGSAIPGYANPTPAAGFRRFGGNRGAFGRGGGGRGFGWRSLFHATGRGWRRFGGGVTPEEGKSLSEEAEALQAQLDLIRKRLEELGAHSAGE